MTSTITEPTPAGNIWRVDSRVAYVSHAVLDSPAADVSATPAIRPQGSELKQVDEDPRPRIKLLGEPFYVEVADGVVYLRHEHWSLLGAGESLSEAYRDLLQEAIDAAPVFADVSPATFDADGLRLYWFLLRFR